MASLKSWIVSFRLRTLPLSLSCIILGSLLSLSYGIFSHLIFWLCIVTTLSLQILSNLANDYGDMITGADNNERIGPARALQKGDISMAEMKRMIIIFVIISAVSGLFLVYYGTRLMSFNYTLVLLAIGLAAIAAAIKYTVGKKPYGYRAMGDLFVLIFFGPVGTMGAFFLHSGFIRLDLIFPSVAIGLMSVAVLNLNNMRDMDSDMRSGKVTLAGILGREKSKIYHGFIILAAITSSLIYTYLNYSGIHQLVYTVVFIPLIFNLTAVIKNIEPAELDNELKKVAMAALAYSILFSAVYIYK